MAILSKSAVQSSHLLHNKEGSCITIGIFFAGRINRVSRHSILLLLSHSLFLCSASNFSHNFLSSFFHIEGVFFTDKIKKETQITTGISVNMLEKEFYPWECTPVQTSCLYSKSHKLHSQTHVIFSEILFEVLRLEKF